MKELLKESGTHSPKRKNYSTELPCVACGASTENGNTYHHVKTRKSGGSDHASNLMPLDQKHHNEVHQIGLTSFSKKYESVNTWLIENGWEFFELTQKWSRCA